MNAKKYIIEAFQTNSPVIKPDLSKYSGDELQLVKAQLDALETANRKHLKELFPSGMVPIYLSPVDPEKEALQLATWYQYDETGAYSKYDDGYCRPDKATGNWEYPRRNPETGLIELAKCDKFITPEVKELIKLQEHVPGMIDIAAVKFIELESGGQLQNIKSKTQELLGEYNKLQDQYIQLNKLLQTNTDLIDRRQAIIDKNMDNLDSIENKYNIKRDITQDNIEDAKRWEKIIARFHFWAKVGVWILLLIVIGLIMLIDIHKVL